MFLGLIKIMREGYYGNVLVYLLDGAPESGSPFRGFLMPFPRSRDALESISRPLKAFLNSRLHVTS